ncbi:hypothetical protein [Streptomyces sp. NBC_01014]|uniref:hypothetical protein n=1 Tax=Streptomyces sp. NBC_01014 TaxID=2903719 RepID=UPI003864961B|nr:hypothetical protein OG282_34490 [Streptomyces sp. NBC_01014]
MSQDLPHWVPERISYSGQFLVGQPGTFRIPDGDLKAGEPTWPVVVQGIQRRLGAAAGNLHRESREAAFAMGFKWAVCRLMSVSA